jgi:hypothetical protein
MQKVHTFRYSVLPGENITIQITPKNFGDSLHSVEAVLDGNAFAPVPGTQDAPTYKFCVTKPVDDRYLVIMEFSFLPDAPDDARYELDISGKDDVGCPCRLIITIDTQDKSPGLKFDVVQEG